MRRFIDSAALTVGVLLMAAVSVVGVTLAEVSDVVTGRRRRRARELDFAHIDESGDRIPLMGAESTRRTVSREWLGL